MISTGDRHDQLFDGWEDEYDLAVWVATYWYPFVPNILN